jgi:hypothetical protein
LANNTNLKLTTTNTNNKRSNTFNGPRISKRRKLKNGNLKNNKKRDKNLKKRKTTRKKKTQKMKKPSKVKRRLEKALLNLSLKERKSIKTKRKLTHVRS